jgi:hypothetical protein
MADITACLDEGCGKRLSCYRFTCPWSNYAQSVWKDSPRKGEECEYYWDNKGWRLDKKYKEHERIGK